ncbi:hypothetical protein ACWEV3_31615 [Saccharopolyspora sp. NPDC003752]
MLGFVFAEGARRCSMAPNYSNASSINSRPSNSRAIRAVAGPFMFAIGPGVFEKC